MSGPVPTGPEVAEIVRHHDHHDAAVDWVVPPSPERIDVVPADPTWPSAYAEVAARVRSALGDAVLGLEHVGSTAVPGLAAKPVIDVDLTLADPREEPAYVPALEAAGFVHVPASRPGTSTARSDAAPGRPARA